MRRWRGSARSRTECNQTLPQIGLGGLAKLLLGTSPSEDRDALTDPSTVELTQGLPGDLVDLALGKPPVLRFKLLLQAREGVLDRCLPRIPAWTHVNSASRFSVPGFGLGAAEGHRVDERYPERVIVDARSQAKPAIPRPRLKSWNALGTAASPNPRI